MLDVFTDLSAYGILLIPKDIKEGEKRPVVVCQHGRNGIPQGMIEGNSTGYNDVGAKLADKGFIAVSYTHLDVLPGTKTLTLQGDIPEYVMDLSLIHISL